VRLAHDSSSSIPPDLIRGRYPNLQEDFAQWIISADFAVLKRCRLL
jgi:hypothetical protein